jgi:hypothetical protein
LTFKRHLKDCCDDEVFFQLSSTPEFHALRGHTPLVHDAMSILVPDRRIFVVKACRAFPSGWERACHFKSNIPRKI